MFCNDEDPPPPAAEVACVGIKSLPERGRLWSNKEVRVVVAMPIEVFKGLFEAFISLSSSRVLIKF